MSAPFGRFSRRSCLVLLCAGVVFSLFPALLQAQKESSSVVPEAKTFWQGMYLDSRKVGWSQVETKPATFQGKPALEVLSKGQIRLKLFNTEVEQNTDQRTLTDLQGRPLRQVFIVKSKDSTLYVEANFDYATRRVQCLIGEGKDATKKTLTIPEGANLASDTNFLLAGKKLSVGDKLSFYYLEPLSVELQEAKIEVVGREKVWDGVKRTEIEANVSRVKMTQGELLSWDTEEGDSVRSELSLGPIRLISLNEPKARALDAAAGLPPEASRTRSTGYTPPADFAVATAITIEKPIAKPRSLRHLTAVISGIPDKRLVLSDARQKVEILPGAKPNAPLAAKYTLTAGPFDATKAITLPFADAKFAPWLSKAAYLDTENPDIAATALKMRGAEKNSYKVAVLLRDWVSANMKPDASIGVPRSATDIFGKRRGVCRDYATLYTALARAAGVPTRLCGGIVYAEGRFFYHAWAESFVGEWVVFDPTLHDLKHPVDFVDATHIKFAQGDVTQMFDTVSVVGKLKISVK